MKLISTKTKIMVFATVVGLAVCGTALSQANELANPNLDTVAIGPQNGITPTGWSVEASKAVSGQYFDGCSSEPWCNVQEIGGYGLFFKPFQGQIGDEISVRFYQDVPGAAATKYTLSGFASGEANFCAFFNTNTPAPKVLFVVMFIDAGNNVLASNVFDLVASGLPVGGGGSMALLTTPQYTAPANTATVRAGVFMLNAYGTSGGQGFFVDAFNLAAELPAGAPVFSVQPTNTTRSAGSTATFTVNVSNPAGVTYQWQFEGNNLSDGGKISGATTRTLTVTDVSAAEVGRYRVRASNAIGTTVSAEASLAIVGVNFFPVISITGRTNDTYRVDYSTAVAPTAWMPLSTNKITISPLNVIDTTSPGNNSRFYRAVLVQP